jgi:hypothetical protein
VLLISEKSKLLKSAHPALSLLVAIHQSSIYWSAFSLYCSRNGAKSFLHHSLKECRCIAHPKVYDIRDVCSIACLYCCFMFVFIGKVYVVIAMLYVEF